MDLFDLTGRVVVVSGGNGGIGLAMAEGLAAAGASICILGRNDAKNVSAVARLEQLGSDAHAIACDVAYESEIVDAMAGALRRFGRIDACIANAGVGAGTTRFTEMTLDEWRKVVQVNLDGAFLTFREAVRHMLDRGEGGSLVVTSSIASLFGMPRGQHYAATKAAVNALVRSVAVEHGRHGIRANAVLPGWVDTAMTEDLFSQRRFEERVLPRIPLGRWGTPADFTGIAVYLVSDAARWHTADTIVIDGGYSVY
jgi:NAD(P)-dependent dehydrogenase (short-subunit alcohol dehydrogenase family)